MDHLRTCMNVLRALAEQSSDPNCYLLAEQQIAEYLQNPGASLEKLSGAIDHEAETWLNLIVEVAKALSVFVADNVAGIVPLLDGPNIGGWS
jgi:hypothetical protein